MPILRPVASDTTSWAPAILAAAEGAGVHVDPIELRDALSAASRANVATPHERLRRTVEAIGLRAVPVLAPSAAVCRLAHRGPVLVWTREGEWLSVVGAEKGRAQVKDARGETYLADAQLAEVCGLPSADHPLLLVAIEAGLPLTGVDQQGHGHGSGHEDDHEVERRGLRRVFRLFRLERADVATCAVYAVFIGLAALMAPVAVQSLVNTVVFTTLTQPLVVLALAVLLALTVSSVLRGMQEWVVERLQQRLFVRTAIDFVTRLTRARVEALDKVPPGDRALRFFDVVTAQKTVSQLLTEGFALVLQAAAGLLLLAFYHPWLLAFDVILIVVLVFVVVVFGRRAIATSVHESHAKYDTATWIIDVARNLEAFRMHPAAAIERAEDLARTYVKERRANFRVVYRQLIASLAVQTLASASLLAVGGWLVLVGQLTVGQLVAAEIVVASVVGGFAKFAKHLVAAYDLATSLEKMGKVLDLPLEKRGGIEHLEHAGPAHLSLHGVHFGYQGRTVFDGFDLVVEPGRRVALLASHGAGKSSLADLVLRLREPAKGTVRIDGVDVRELDTEELRAHVAVVRNPAIFAGTVFDNVALQRRGVGPRDVHRALEAVGLSSLVSRFKDGVGARLASGGAPLSLGEAQRLVLARALVGSPRLLIIDGLLDVLDPTTLGDLEACLAGLEKTTTVVVLTADPAVAQFCHDVVMLARTRVGAKREPTAAATPTPAPALLAPPSAPTTASPEPTS